MASTYLTRTPSSTGNLRTFTISFWVKRSRVNHSGYSQQIIGQTASDYFRLMFQDGTDQLNYYDESGMSKKTNRVFRDVNAWYHIVLRIDTTQGTASNRNRLYVNGVEETSFATDTNSGQNTELHFNRQHLHSIGRSSSSGGYDYFDGCLADFMVVDGQSLPPTSFAETDATTGEWKPKDLADDAFTWGTNGFRILKDGMTVTDQSTNSNNWTAYGSLTKTEDSPSNVFATLNPLDVMKQSGGIYVPTFSNGNTTMSASATNNYQTFGSIAVDTGKYYWEMKCPNGANGNLGSRIGLFHGDNKVHGGSYYNGADGYNIHQNGLIYTNGASTTYMAGFSNNIIITFALDKTNGLSYVGANGYWADGNGNTNQSFANAVAVETKLSTTMPDKTTYAMFDVYGSTTQHINFGNGYFGTTAVSSAGTNASGNGIFEYDVPTGYTALSTKGLNL